MQFEIKSRRSGAVVFTAEIEADSGTLTGIKLGLAVKAAVKANANLSGAYLSGAYLSGADLSGAYLSGADLSEANLRWANLSGADLRWANLSGADLSEAHLRWANLSGADLSEAHLNGVCGLNDWIKCLQVEDWPISYTSEVMQIGCQRHTFDAWKNFSDAQIRVMDGRRALTFWAKWKETIFKIIEMAPAKSTEETVSGPAETTFESTDA